MASLLDAVFMPVAALFTIFFLLPGVLLAPQNSADFATAVSIPNSRMMVQSMMMTYFMDEGSDEVSNYKAISYKLSGKPNTPSLDKESLQRYPILFSYFKLSYSSTYSSNDFNDEILGNPKPERENLFYSTKIPVRGGDVGDIQVRWQVY